MSYDCKNTLVVEGDEWQDFVNENTGRKGGIDFNLGYPLENKTKLQKYNIWGSILAMSGQGEWRENKLEFYTLNFPPTSYLVHMSQKYPGLTFTLGYEEWSKDICGILNIKNGKIKQNADIDNYFEEIYGFKEINDVMRAIEDEYTLELTLCDIRLLNLGDNETEITRYMRHLDSINWDEEWENYVEKHLEN